MSNLFEFPSGKNISYKNLEKNTTNLEGFPLTNDETLYKYSFFVDLSESKDFDSSMYEIFFFLCLQKIEIVFTESEFEAFKESLFDYGLEIEYAERVPFSFPEEVF